MKNFEASGAWKGTTAGGCMNFPSWRYNPQLFLTVQSKVLVTITLNQALTKNYSIGFYLAKAKKSGVRQLAIPAEEIVAHVGFEDLSEISKQVVLESGTYVVIPCTFSPGEETTFRITIHSDDDIKIEELSPNDEWTFVTQKGEWKDKSAGGCPKFPSFLNNPQFVLKADEPTHAVILLSQTEKTSDFDSINFYIFETKSVKGKLTAVTPKDVIAKGEFAKISEAAIEFDLQPKKIYALIPCTFNPGKECAFELTVFSDKDIKLHELKG